MGKFSQKLLAAALATSVLFGSIGQSFADSGKKTGPDSPVAENSSLKSDKEVDDYIKSSRNQKLRVVVELKEDSVLDKAEEKGLSVRDLNRREFRSMERKVEDSQTALKSKLKRKNIATYKSDGSSKDADEKYTTVINGFSTYIDGKDYEKIKSMEEVKNVYLTNMYTLPKEVEPSMTSSGEMIGATTVHELGYKGQGMVVSIIDSGFDVNHKDFNITDSSKVALSKEKVGKIIQESKLPGKYYNEKFPYAYNYYDLTDHIISTVSNHGQHVAGTVAANGEIKGVAPEAQLLGMKVFSDDPLYSYTYSDIYAKAIDDSIKLGADAINMSLGSPAGMYIYGNIEDKAIKRASEAGVLVSIAGGNEHTITTGMGNYGDLLAHDQGLAYPRNPDTGLVGSPSLYRESLAVASINNVRNHSYVIEFSLGKDSGETPVSYAQGAKTPWENGIEKVKGSDLAVINTSNMGDKSKAPGDLASFKNNADKVKGKFLLVERGNSFKDTIDNAQDFGAIGVIVYNNDRGEESDNLINMLGGEDSTIPLCMIGMTDGRKIVNYLKGEEDKDSLVLKFPKDMKEIKAKDGGQMSDFSSWGTTPELQIKPEITAPGGNIYSTDNNDGYVNMSGTSMATPHVAGATALVCQRIIKDEAVFGKLSKKDRMDLAKILMMNTASPISDPYGNTYLVRQQGAGLLNLEEALSTETYIVEKESQEAKAELGSFTGNKLEMTFEIHNKSKKAKNFTIEAEALTDQVEDIDDVNYLTERSQPIYGVKLSSAEKVYVNAGGTKEVKVTLDLSEAIENKEIKANSFVEGFVHFKAEGKDLSLPYLSFYGSWEDLHVFDEPVTNLNDDDPTNDPLFTTTGLIRMTENGNRYRSYPTIPTYINPNKLEEKDRYAFMTTILRDFDHAVFTIEDKDGRVLENLGTYEVGIKISRLDQGEDPFTIFYQSYWDGKIAGESLAEGRSVYYTVKAYYKENSKPQTIRFEVRADYDKPNVEIVNYDENDSTLTFKAGDEESGIYAVYLINEDNGQVVTVSGQDLINARTDGNAKDGTYSINLNEWGINAKNLVVQVADFADNANHEFIELGGEEGHQPETPELDSINENTVSLSAEIEQGGILIIEDSEDKPILEASADGDGFVEGRFNRELKAGEELFAYVVVDDNRSEAKNVKVFHVNEDTSNPLPPQLFPIYSIDEEAKETEISGICNEKGLKILVKSGDKLIAESSTKEDGNFSFKLKKENYEDLGKIKVYAQRESAEGNPTSEPVDLSITVIPAPDLDGGSVFEDDEKVRGNAHRPNAEVIIEKEGKDQTKEEVARGNANDKGLFEIDNPGLENGDKIYLYSLIDGLKSAESSYVVGEDPNLMKEGDLNIYLEEPEFLGQHNTHQVHFKGSIFGWDNVDEISWGKHKFKPTVSTHQHIYNPHTGDHVFYGKVYNIDENVDVEKDGLYNTPLIVRDGSREVGISRRFRVDTKKPEVELEIAGDTENSKKTLDDSHKEVTIKTHGNSVKLTFNIKDDNLYAEVQKNGNLFYLRDLGTYQGMSQYPVKLSVNDIITFAEDENEKEYTYDIYDIVGNSVSYKVKVTREGGEKPAESEDESPLITAYDRYVFKDQQVNLLDFAKATGSENEDLTSEITVNPDNIDTSKPGDYTVTYSVHDSIGRATTKEITVHVLGRTNSLLDYEKLIEALTGSENYQGEDYSASSYEEFASARKEAEYLLKVEEEGLDQDQIDDVTNRLNNALAGLVDIRNLVQEKEYIDEILEDSNNGLNEDQLEKLKALQDKLNQSLENEEISKDDVQEIEIEIEKVNKDLEEELAQPEVPAGVNKEELKEQIQKAEKISGEEYTKESFDNLKKNLDKARDVLNNSNASQTDVDEAVKDLKSALDSLEKVLKKGTLEEVIKNLEEYLNDEEISQDQKEQLEELLKKAYALKERENISQEDLNKAVVEIQNEFSNIKTARAQDELLALVNKMNELLDELSKEIDNLKTLEAKKLVDETYQEKLEKLYEKYESLLKNAGSGSVSDNKKLEEEIEALRKEIEGLKKDLPKEIKVIQEGGNFNKGKATDSEAARRLKASINDLKISKESLKNIKDLAPNIVAKNQKEYDRLVRDLDKRIDKSEKTYKDLFGDLEDDGVDLPSGKLSAYRKLNKSLNDLKISRESLNNIKDFAPNIVKKNQKTFDSLMKNINERIAKTEKAIKKLG